MRISLGGFSFKINSLFVLIETIKTIKKKEEKDYIFNELMKNENFNFFIKNNYALIQVIDQFPKKKILLLEQALKNSSIVNSIRSRDTTKGLKKLTRRYPKQNDLLFHELFHAKIHLEKFVYTSEREFDYDALKDLVRCFPKQKSSIFKTLFSDEKLLNEWMPNIDYIGLFVDLFPDHEGYFFKLKLAEQEVFDNFIHNPYCLAKAIEIFPKKADFILERALKNPKFCINFTGSSNSEHILKKIINHFPKRNDFIFAQTFGNPNVFNVHVYSEKSIKINDVQIILNLFPNHKTTIFKALAENESYFESKNLKQLRRLTNLFNNFREEIYYLSAAKTAYLNKHILTNTLSWAMDCYFNTSGLKELVALFPEHANDIFYGVFPNLEAFQKWVTHNLTLKTLSTIFPEKTALKARNLNQFIQQRLIAAELKVRHDNIATARKACLEALHCFFKIGVLEILPTELLHEIFTYVFPYTEASEAKQRKEFVASLFFQPKKCVKDKLIESTHQRKKNCSIM